MSHTIITADEFEILFGVPAKDMITDADQFGVYGTVFGYGTISGDEEYGFFIPHNKPNKIEYWKVDQPVFSN